MKKPVRVVVSTAAIGSLMVLTGACSKTAEPVATGPNASTTPSGVSATSPTKESVTPTTEKSTGTTKKTVATDKPSTTDKKTTTTKAGKLEGAAFATQAIEAFKAKLGDYKALEIVIHVDSVHNAEAQVQDPAKPANVDSYDFKGVEVGTSVPVKLSGGGELEDNLFVASSVAWDQLPAMLDQAKASFPDITDSKGVTHLIIKKNLPFDDDTVINVYVDGGARGNGGYVSFKADGSLKKVYGSK